MNNETKVISKVESELVSPNAESVYLDLLRRVMEQGSDKSDRTGVGTRSTFGDQIRFNLNYGFPLLTTKKVALRPIIHELLWFIKGDTNIKYLLDNNVHIWDEWPFKRYLQLTGGIVPDVGSHDWITGLLQFGERLKRDEQFARDYGDLGPVYGKQWRAWPTPDGHAIDQLRQVVEQIKNTPDSRRMVVNAWNVADINEMAKAGLPPCHCLFQFYVDQGKLSCKLYQRSGDLFLGVPFNMASYSLLTMMIAQEANLQPGEFIHTFGDAHIYKNHFSKVEEQLSRQPFSLPNMHLNPAKSKIEDFVFEDFTLENYQAHPAIKASVAV